MGIVSILVMMKSQSNMPAADKMKIPEGNEMPMNNSGK